MDTFKAKNIIVDSDICSELSNNQISSFKSQIDRSLLIGESEKIEFYLTATKPIKFMADIFIETSEGNKFLYEKSNFEINFPIKNYL